MHRRSGAGAIVAAAVAAAMLVWAPPAARAQEGTPVTPEQVAAAIDQLGNLEYVVRAKAAQTVRRAPATIALNALLRAVDEHADGYVRFRALVLLSGFADPRTHEAMVRAIDDPNDRLREVGYAWLESHPDRDLAPQLVKRLATELADFVRPALIRALAALGAEAAVQKALVQEAFKGQDFFRSAVIEALGEHKATYAVRALTEIAKLEGPLRDDAVLALGRIGDVKAVETFAALQRSAPRDEQPVIAASICLTGRNCESHRRFLVETLSFAVKEIGFQELVRSAAVGLGALATNGDALAFQSLVDAGIAARDPARAPIALAVGRVAVRNPAFVLESLGRFADPDAAILLLRDAFDMLEEDLEEERFFVFVRKAFWQAAEDSTTRRVGNRLISILEF